MTKLNPNLRWYLVTLFLLAVCSLFSTSEGAAKDKPVQQTAIAKKKEKAERQRRAVEKIRKLSGFVDYDYQFDEKGQRIPEEKQQLPGTKQQRRQLGIDYLATVVEVVFINSELTDEKMVILKDLKQLKVVFIDGAKLTGTGLVHLKGLTRLKKLLLEETLVTDAALVHLKGLTRLEMLGLETTKVTDAGLVHLKGLTRLKMLELGNTKVTAEGVAKLQKSLPDCEIDWNDPNNSG